MEAKFKIDFSDIKKKRLGFDFLEEKSKIDFDEEMVEVKIDMRKFFELRKKTIRVLYTTA